MFSPFSFLSLGSSHGPRLYSSSRFSHLSFLSHLHLYAIMPDSDSEDAEIILSRPSKHKISLLGQESRKYCISFALCSLTWVSTEVSRETKLEAGGDEGASMQNGFWWRRTCSVTSMEVSGFALQGGASSWCHIHWDQTSCHTWQSLCWWGAWMS